MAGEGNGRSYDAQIAEVVLQAIVDGHRTYREAVDVVHAQAPLRAAEVRKAGGTKDEIKAERRRWENFGKCSITRWKRDNGEFERELMDVEDCAAQEQVEEVRKLGEEAVEISDDTSLDWRERQTRLQGRRQRIAVEMWAIGTRLNPRKTWHDSTPASPRVAWPIMPPNRGFDRATPPGRDDDRPN